MKKAKQPHECITEREKEVLGLLEQGLSTVEMAEKLKISHYTVKSHIEGIFDKLGVNRRKDAVLAYKALNSGEYAACQAAVI